MEQPANRVTSTGLRAWSHCGWGHGRVGPSCFLCLFYCWEMTGNHNLCRATPQKNNYISPPWHLLGTWTTGLHPVPPSDLMLFNHSHSVNPHQERSTLNTTQRHTRSLYLYNDDSIAMLFCLISSLFFFTFYFLTVNINHFRPNKVWHLQHILYRFQADWNQEQIPVIDPFWLAQSIPSGTAKALKQNS